MRGRRNRICKFRIKIYKTIAELQKDLDDYIAKYIMKKLLKERIVSKNDRFATRLSFLRACKEINPPIWPGKMQQDWDEWGALFPIGKRDEEAQFGKITASQIGRFLSLRALKASHFNDDALSLSWCHIKLWHHQTFHWGKFLYRQKKNRIGPTMKWSSI